jgi:hypothetical protein
VIVLPAGASPDGLVLTTFTPGGVCVPTTVNPSLSSSRFAWGKFMPITSGIGTRGGVLDAAVLAAVLAAGPAVGAAVGALAGEVAGEPASEAERDPAGEAGEVEEAGEVGEPVREAAGAAVVPGSGGGAGAPERDPDRELPGACAVA